MATTRVQRALRIVQTETDAPGHIEYLFEGDSEDGKKGEPVQLSSGFLVKRSAASEKIFGFLMDDMENSATAETDGDKVRVLVLSTNQYFVGSMSGVSAATDRGKSYGIVESGTVTDAWHVNKSDTSNKKVTIIDLLEPVGDTNTLVKVKFIATQMQADISI